ncbi:hypothetical protein CONPUDRAFT_154272 [Coniophora puteana RWD-64-598 SS2]|uniref:ATP phosphoribosyltransferase n=1 Tax=Coniophora puteana (strain RWD-64-598) TaxID=741705 RepID=A0A5M3MNC4_CONPW|nr:uncharacterized protein CONPUDRAFT_154272 [Coniophora puteana RWD-64-598 SS2]EIW80225.1 hypothetical protein CONPUDRAFT_154272 [Coniophora puteana RWD-64-598 SS2]
MSLVRFKLVFFAPRKNTKAILKQLFVRLPNAVGKIGDYQECAFVTPGTGQFRPGASANPAIGKPGTLEYVSEDRIEVVVNDQGNKAELRKVVEALKAVHPYEEVAYDVYRLEDL